ncbi:uncharacterized protein YbjT (DUF2867 family) [Tamaricihabitans halophyticus]|uniref:Uncharacterized protein YbjT (DUF2867 family) n=1 Tax=Tamaricihabitans halophyticus TaxID=1262583 RepID=A0A4R2QQ91_9PSEU|nr:NAD(P)H-binding protein [Tamaricihabitans halophyticus]TCP51903.1 uncharacterized protein YbjT (DUF2867 family) [Tamaricihabitans halophyticus]
MAVLVTGATGTVGRQLTAQLVAEGQVVRAMTRNPAGANPPSGAAVVGGDLTDADSLVDALAGVDAVHLIDFDATTYSALPNGADVVRRVADAGARKVTVLQGDIEKTPLVRALEASDLEWTLLAPVEFMANTLEWAESIRTEGVVRDGFAAAKSAMVHEADIAAVAAVALTTDGHAGQEYWLTGPESLNAREKVDTLAEVLGRRLRFVELSQDEIVAQWRQAGFADSDIDYFLAMRTNPSEAGYTVQETVHRVTGRAPRTFADWVRENAASFR